MRRLSSSSVRPFLLGLPLGFLRLIVAYTTAHYINPDGIQVATQIAYISQDNKIFFTGSVEAWNVANGGAAVVVCSTFLVDVTCLLIGVLCQTFHLEESF